MKFLPSAKLLTGMGLKIYATAGTTTFLKSNGIAANMLYKIHEHKKPNVLDYLLAKNNQIIPIEVKSGTRGQLKSLQMFLETKPNSPYGIRFSTHNYSNFEKIKSYPLYAVAKIIGR